ncbi:hypothetical protein EMCG_08729 [[Emmonsia] crescens]|uniref:Uncharacterized protein n=1 Tax=[Emmonsia] crescens TaxID=73230 RepID=A0A0G2J406_9EURO|nr:hypothetical protein EMCG_08729 [Emmonsia crescens UAMH 3008]
MGRRAETVITTGVTGTNHSWMLRAQMLLNQVDYLCHRFRLVCFEAGVMLIKVRMLLDLKDLQTSIASATPRRHLRSSIIAKL